MSLKTHLTREGIKQYGMSPLGIVTPEYIGQYCMTEDNKVYFANGITSNDWIEASGSGGNLEALQDEINANKSSISELEKLVGQANKILIEEYNKYIEI